MGPKSFAVAAILLCVSGFLGGGPVQAADYFNPFEVKEVPVDITADTAANARTIAIGEAQSRALDLLLRRMTLKGDRDRLPRLDGNSVSRLVQSIQFADERYSSTRYIAKVTVAFNPGGIRSLLGRYNIPFAEAPAHPVLVLPVLDSGSSRIAAESNPWWAAWSRQDWQENLLALTLPQASDVDASGLSAAEVMQGGGPWIEALGRRYGTSEVVVPLATLRTDGGAARLIVRTHQYGIAGERSSTRELNQLPGETIDNLLMRGAREIGNDLTQEWKRNAMVGQGAQTDILAVMDLASLQQLITLQDRLKRVPMLKNATLASLASHRALFRMTVTVPPEQLTPAMIQYGIDLVQRDGDWYVSPRR
ncbi:DUF2066 domain-containing protein [Emcibacter sp. SYSU 3D8]|uniref:DUF2066 domain-containing protein n=1 Tax=Emcibacter sp. SYSU 3D8 TaxID=3133969 RepID=UPI0031FF06BC